ncbi:hypothetical protein 015DV002_252 [Bacillus phage 015DV002]|nr:hypothetical protein 015DV002_4 [Bacillus phage 015DV002]QQO41206.1 hypothetical protein 015DV002_252 [Bacillus phage 015DV002]
MTKMKSTTIKGINHLSVDAQEKAYQDFLRYTRAVRERKTGDYPFTEFVRISEVNGWQYDEQGNLI